MSNLFTRGRGTLVFVAGLTSLLFPAATSAASSVSSIRAASGALVVDTTTGLLVSGLADPTDGAWQWVTVDLNPSSLACAPTWQANADRRVTGGPNETVEGQFSDVSVNLEPTSPGQYTACAYIWEMWSKATVGAGAAPITVRKPTSSLQISLPANRFPMASTATFDVTSSAEIKRDLTVEVNPFGVNCGPNVYANADVTKWIDGAEIAGGPITMSHHADTPARGRYQLCGYVSRSSADAVPDLVYRGPDFWVGPAPSCSLGPAPRRPSGKVVITCSGSDGPVELTARRGAKTFRTTVGLAGGRGAVSGRAIGLKRRSRVTVSLAIDGVQVGRRTLRVR